MKTVLVIQQQMKQYRLPFFTALGEALLRDNICLKVAYSEPRNRDGRNDNCDLPPELGLKVKSWQMFGERILWQPLLWDAIAANLVIAEQANKLVLNYLLVLLSLVGFRQVAFWGMGEDRCADKSELSEWVRRHAAKMVNWWFTYTPATAKFLTSNGVLPDRITIVNNSVDTRSFSESVRNIGDSEIAAVRQQLGIEPGCRVGLFCGALGAHKGIGFLLDCAQLIREQVPDFHLLVLGSGLESSKVEAVSKSCPWVHYVGPKFGPEKALFFKMADIFLLPEGVGLGILDGFAAGLPLITTDFDHHGPEIEYLESGRNGVLTEHNIRAYASAAGSLLQNPQALDRLKEAARETGQRYSIEAMVENFRSGIKSCLELQ